MLAYIDPNTGGMLFQILAVAFGLISGFLLFFSGRIKLMWARFRRSARGEDEEDDQLMPEQDDEAPAEGSQEVAG